MGFDISNFKQQYEISLQSVPGVKFICKRPSDIEQDNAYKNAKGKSGGLEKPSQFYKRMFIDCVEDWEGFENGGKEYKCTRDNKQELFSLNYALCTKVIDELQARIDAELEIESGN